MAGALTILYSDLYELAKEFPSLRPTATNPRRFTSFCPIHGKDKTSDLEWELDSNDDVVIICKVCGSLTLDAIRNPSPVKPVEVRLISDLELEPLTESGFDYSALTQDADEVKAATMRIKARLKRSVADIVEIGKELTIIKNRLPHGQFLPWITAEFEMSKDSAQNFMSVWDRFGKNGIVPNLKPTVLYELSAPSTPDSVIEQAVEAADRGDVVTVAEVKEWKAERVGKVKTGNIGKVKPADKPEPVKPVILAMQPGNGIDAAKFRKEIREADIYINTRELIDAHSIPDEYHAELFEASKGWAVNSDASNREGTSIAVKGFMWWDEKSGALAKRRIEVGEKAKHERLVKKFGESPFETTVFKFVEDLRVGNSAPIANLMRCIEHFDSLNDDCLMKLGKLLADIRQSHNAGIDQLDRIIDSILIPVEKDITPITRLIEDNSTE